MITERMAAIKAKWMWTNTTQHLADGLTKVRMRQHFADIFRRGKHALKFDPDFVAGKKLTKKQKEDREQELDHAVAQDGMDATIHHLHRLHEKYEKATKKAQATEEQSKEENKTWWKIKRSARRRRQNRGD